MESKATKPALTRSRYRSDSFDVAAEIIRLPMTSKNLPVKDRVSAAKPIISYHDSHAD
ncbi:hypothetical protein ACFQ0E_03075 [Lysobacter brunescens]|uniref:Uncharacterized protein n=1 Tax=Lysobacter brunescens TaxID=262323 RepID=A0ABW2YBM4_9GAMM